MTTSSQMVPDILAAEHRTVLLGCVGISLAFFAIQAALPASHHIAAICGQLGLLDAVDPDLLKAVIWSPFVLVLGWFIMIWAMMLPLIAGHLSVIARETSGQPLAIPLIGFVGGYVAVWMLAGIVLLPIGFFATLLFPPVTSTVVVTAVAVFWMSTSWCQRHVGKGAPGGLKGGLATGWDCVLTSWPLMILPMTFHEWHIPAMIGVTVIMIAMRSSLARAFAMRAAGFVWQTRSNL